MALQLNIPIGLPGTIATPPAGEVTQFFDTTFSPPKLSYKDENGDVFLWPFPSGSNADSCCCEIAEKLIGGLGCAIKSGIITMADFQTFMNSGAVISGNTTDDGQGNTTCNVTIGSTNIPTTALALVSTPFSIDVAEQAPILYTKTPANSTSPIIWTSSDVTKVTVDQNGVVTGVAIGSSTITASVNGVSISILITVI